MSWLLSCKIKYMYLTYCVFKYSTPVMKFRAESKTAIKPQPNWKVRSLPTLKHNPYSGRWTSFCINDAIWQRSETAICVFFDSFIACSLRCGYKNIFTPMYCSHKNDIHLVLCAFKISWGHLRAVMSMKRALIFSQPAQQYWHYKTIYT